MCSAYQKVVAQNTKNSWARVSEVLTNLRPPTNASILDLVTMVKKHDAVCFSFPELTLTVGAQLWKLQQLNAAENTKVNL